MSIRQKTLYNKTLVDICSGYSKGVFNKRPLFVKHLSTIDQIYFDDFQFEEYEKALKEGLPTEEDAMASAMQDKLWTKKDEKEVVQTQIALEGLNKTKTKNTNPKILEKLEDSIIEAKAKLVMLDMKKNRAIGETCESYVSKLLNNEYLYKNTFADENFKKPFFKSREDFDEMDLEEYNFFVGCYEKILEPCSEENIKKLCIQDFFINSFGLSENPVDFFGKKISEFTFYQTKLACWGKYYISLFAANDLSKVPEKYRNDPDKLVEFTKQSEAAKKAAEKMSKHEMVFVGAGNEDSLSMMGMQHNPERDFKEVSTLTEYLNKKRV